MFTNIMNKNNNKNKNSKQKSILDYFNKTIETKRKFDCFEDNVHSFDQKVLKTKNQNKTTPELVVIDVIDENINKSDDVFKDFSNEEFIDLNLFLEIDVTVEDNQTNETKDGSIGEDIDPNEDNYMKGSYIYDNFRQMIDFVLNDKQFSHLFGGEDLDVIQSFTCLSGLAQMLFMRLFMRKHWIRKNAIKYPEIADNLDPILEELIENQFLFNATHLSDLRQSLSILDTNELKRIGRSLNGLNMSSLNTKKTISTAIIKYLNTSQPVIKSDKQSDSLNEVILKSIKSVLKNKCFKLNENLCNVFERMGLLFCQPEISDEELTTSFNYEFFKIERVETGKQFYPKYTINKRAAIYKTGEDLHRYCRAFKLEIEILSAIEKKDFNQVTDNLLTKARNEYLNVMNEKVDQNDALLPPFLRRYTGGQSYTRCISHCVSVLEHNKNYSEAVLILRDVLLSQTIYCEDYRGRWFERLALNLDKHLKDSKSSLETIEKALIDEFVRTGHRLALYKRRKSIQKSLKISIELMSEYESIRYSETTIFAETIKYTINDRKNIFKITDSNGNVIVMPVEDIVLNHYRNNGYTDGLHTESRVYHTILGLLFWDIIYMSDSFVVSDAFRFRNQRLPLDLNSDQFFGRRKPQINSLLNTLKNLNELEMNNVLENSWNSNVGTVSVINWENPDINQIKEIAICFGSSIITDICDRLIKDFRHTRSGLPDLLVWNCAKKQIKAVEVKGPNDRPSNKQLLWLSFLQSIGVDVEICHVKVKKGLTNCE